MWAIFFRRDSACFRIKFRIDFSIDFGSPQEAPRAAQDRPKTPQDRPKTLRDAPKSPQDRPRQLQDRLVQHLRGKTARSRRSRTTRTAPADYRVPPSMHSTLARPARGTSLRGGGGSRPQGVLDPPPPAQQRAACYKPHSGTLISSFLQKQILSNLLSKVLGRLRLRAPTALPPVKLL